MRPLICLHYLNPTIYLRHYLKDYSTDITLGHEISSIMWNYHIISNSVNDLSDDLTFKRYDLNRIDFKKKIF